MCRPNMETEPGYPGFHAKNAEPMEHEQRRGAEKHVNHATHKHGEENVDDNSPVVARRNSRLVRDSFSDHRRIPPPDLRLAARSYCTVSACLHRDAHLPSHGSSWYVCPPVSNVHPQMAAPRRGARPKAVGPHPSGSRGQVLTLTCAPASVSNAARSERPAADRLVRPRSFTSPSLRPRRQEVKRIPSPSLSSLAGQVAHVRTWPQHIGLSSCPSRYPVSSSSTPPIRVHPCLSVVPASCASPAPREAKAATGVAALHKLRVGTRQAGGARLGGEPRPPVFLSAFIRVHLRFQPLALRPLRRVGVRPWISLLGRRGGGPGISNVER